MKELIFQISSLFSYHNSMVKIEYNHWRWFGKKYRLLAVCEFYGFAGATFGLVSINTMAAISLDRYNVIVRTQLNREPPTGLVGVTHSSSFRPSKVKCMPRKLLWRLWARRSWICLPQALRAHYVKGIYSRERDGPDRIISLLIDPLRYLRWTPVTYIMRSLCLWLH